MKLNLKAAAGVKAGDDQKKEDEGFHRILLVDDELPNLNGLSRQLSDQYNVLTFQSAVDALKMVDKGGDEGRFSVVISDQIMPEMSGVEFLRELHKRTHPAPRIMLTGYAALDNVISAVNEASIFRYMTKPVFPDQLLRTVHEAIKHFEVHRENSRLVTLVKQLLEKNAELSKTVHSLSANDLNANIDTDDFAPKRVPLAVLFADIRGFTALSRTVEPEALIKVLDTIICTLHEVVYRFGGVVDKHLGDGLMAVFGLSGESMLNTALAATENMAERSRAILESLPAPFDKLKLSFGLASGDVVLGMIGSINRSELAVIGDIANLAARLQELSKVTLTSDQGRQSLGEFKRVMAICSGSLLTFPSNFTKAKLLDEVSVRDFPEIKEVGVFSC
jgi:class 3 adenylate cyclase/CheY-like chemotaxis protein